ncbi:hypothetical protein LB467_03055 [Salegentibacter sp. JZCK2]|uniref:hypothetical protein n=1 Tax=Salegentibacter tibetensis TaxID=2873600 RepID=UPI001CC9AFD5|nr:hypothetical protein [Salegentibacter tibetensis]MBZ9728653.1 hypothetical protein [Salegentibacter tibetensis]
MKTSHLCLFTLLTVLLSSNYLQGQNNNNKIVVKAVYDLLQNKNANSNEISALTNGINWDEIGGSKKGINSKYSISFNAIMKNEWENILFKNLNFKIPEDDKVLVTGTVNGRQSTECEFISTQFKHYWSLKDGKIVHFLE